MGEKYDDSVGENESVEKEKVDVKGKAKKVADSVIKGGGTAVVKTKDALTAAQKATLNALDQDGNGKIDSVDIILMAMKVPGVRIDRAKFLEKELFKNYPKEIIDKAVETNPAIAGIKKEDIDKIADEVIKFERNAVSGISVVLGVPGGAAMAATIPADIAQYYGYMIRCAQKMLYLYGFPEIDTSEDSLKLDTETINYLTVCLGIMYGVANANNAIKAMAKALATGVEKKLLNAALTKGTIYPIVKSVAKWFSVKMTKEVFAGFFKKAIPVVGGVIGGGLTFATFKPCCYRLKDALQDTMLSNPEHIESCEEKELFENIQSGVIDMEPEDIRDISMEENVFSDEDEE